MTGRLSLDVKSISPELVTGQVPVSLEIALAVVGLFVGGLMNAVADRIPPLDPEYDGPFIAEQNRPLKWWEFLPFLSTARSRAPFPARAPGIATSRA